MTTQTSYPMFGASNGGQQPVEGAASQGVTLRPQSKYSLDDLKQAVAELKLRIGYRGAGKSAGVRAEGFEDSVQPVEPSQTYRGIGIGAKVSGAVTRQAIAEGEDCVLVMVPEKLPESELGSLVVPRDVAGIPTDVIECGEVVAQPIRIPNGAGIRASRGGADAGMVGTLGGLCTRDGDPNLYLLSNAHVLTPDARFFASRQTVVKSLQDSPMADDTIGQLQFWSGFRPGTNHKHDAALARTGPNVVVGGNVGPGMQSASAGIRVTKTGLTTRQTFGIIQGISMQLDVAYEFGTFHFVNVILIVPDMSRNTSFSKGGDSGSLVVTESGTVPVGLHFAGDEAQTSFSIPIQTVAAAFGISGFVGTV